MSKQHTSIIHHKQTHTHTLIYTHMITYVERGREGEYKFDTHTHKKKMCIHTWSCTCKRSPYSRCAGCCTKCGPAVKSKLLWPWTAQGQSLDSQEKKKTCRAGWLVGNHIPIWWFPKLEVYPWIIHFSGIFQYKPTILGYRHSRKPPFHPLPTLIQLQLVSLPSVFPSDWAPASAPAKSGTDWAWASMNNMHSRILKDRRSPQVNFF